MELFSKILHSPQAIDSDMKILCMVHAHWPEVSENMDTFVDT
jgi:hypothetical protein